MVRKKEPGGSCCCCCYFSYYHYTSLPDPPHQYLEYMASVGITIGLRAPKPVPKAVGEYEGGSTTHAGDESHESHESDEGGGISGREEGGRRAM